MRCKVIFKHHPVELDMARDKIEKVFGAQTLPTGQFSLESELFKNYPQINDTVIYYNRLMNIFYAFLRLDMSHTQLWIECTLGRETFSHVERIINNSMVALRQSQTGWKQPCKIESSLFYELVDTESLDITAKGETLISQLTSLLSRANVLALFFTWVITVTVVFLLAPVGNRNLGLLLQPSFYAPAGIILAALLRLAYNFIRHRRGVVIYVGKSE
jgi:hypothetical protein